MKRRRLRLPTEIPLPSPPADSDASARTDEPRRRAPDPEEERRERIRRQVVAFLFVSVFVAGVFAALFGDRGWLDLWRSRRELVQLEADRARQQERVADLRRELRRLRDDPSAIERIARERLGMVGRDEIVFVLPDEDGSVLEPLTLAEEDPASPPPRPR